MYATKFKWKETKKIDHSLMMFEKPKRHNSAGLFKYSFKSTPSDLN